MAERLAAVEQRIASVRQLSSVVTAMRGIAAARSTEARRRLPGIAAYSEAIGDAISRILALLAGPRQSASGEGLKLVIALCAEQGFAGAFNRKVIDRLLQSHHEGDVLFMVGSRGLAFAAEHDLEIAWSAPMAGHVDQLDDLANCLADALFERIASEAIGQISMVHASTNEGAEGVDIVERVLVPFDFSRFPPLHSAIPPLTQIPLPLLLQRLSEEYIFAELCEGLTVSFAAENAERMRAMISARKNVAERLEELTAEARLLRQAEITEEVIELAAVRIAPDSR